MNNRNHEHRLRTINKATRVIVGMLFIKILQHIQK